MGTTFEVIVPSGHRAADRAVRAVRTRVEREELRCSRFRPDSELTHVNRAAGRPTSVSSPFAALVTLALEAADRTRGRFDPTVHDALVAAGYDRDFDELLAGARGALRPPVPCGRWAEAEVDGRTLTLPAGVHLDLGGIAKGWTADRATEDALRVGVPWIAVNAGGDLRVAGDAPTLSVAVEDPEVPGGELLRLRIREGGLATSSVAKRTWAPGRHHVIDPRTGLPADTELLQATVWAATAVEAEVAATDALLRGPTAVEVPSVLVDRHGGVHVSCAVEEAA
jgi:thiamine biosynthesis lipoprotein